MASEPLQISEILSLNKEISLSSGKVYCSLVARSPQGEPLTIHLPIAEVQKLCSLLEVLLGKQ
jgi:hypothetical protein